MSRQQNLRMAIVIGIAVVCAGLRTWAQERDVKVEPGPQFASAPARRDAAKFVYEASWRHHLDLPQTAPYAIEYYHDWSVRWMQAERDLASTKAEQIVAVEAHLKRMNFWKDSMDKARERGQETSYGPKAAEFFRLEADDWLTAAKVSGK